MWKVKEPITIVKVVEVVVVGAGGIVHTFILTMKQGDSPVLTMKQTDNPVLKVVN